jgi:hypothetical protein
MVEWERRATFASGLVDVRDHKSTPTSRNTERAAERRGEENTEKNTGSTWENERNQSSKAGAAAAAETDREVGQGLGGMVFELHTRTRVHTGAGGAHVFTHARTILTTGRAVNEFDGNQLPKRTRLPDSGATAPELRHSTCRDYSYQQSGRAPSHVDAPER